MKTNLNALLFVFLVLTVYSSCWNNDAFLQKNDPHLVLNIVVAQTIPTDHKVPMLLEVIKADTTFQYNGSIERRGGFSISFPKHSYEIDLKKDIALGKLPADDDWILNANYIDKTFIRHTFAYSLFRDMHPNNRAALYTYVELNLNGDYRGLYILMEKLDKSSLDILKRDTSAFIFKEPPVFTPNIKDFIAADKNNFHQQTFPKIAYKDKSAVMAKIRFVILNTNDKQFSRQIIQLFDINNIIDWHLLLLMTKNNDGLLKNFYLYKTNAATPFRVAPWDYDHSFGRDGDNELNLKKPIDLTKSILFKQLLLQEWYQKALRKRWYQLNEQGLLSVDGLKKRLYQLRSTIDPLVLKNFDKWPVNGAWYYDGNNYKKEIDIMINFIDTRHKELSTLFL